ncbi:uncharacterized protein [Physcomitrium patens]|uniref:Mo25-like protein n=2 Tax=Physcomitrium patens TaxID=3218 RepID=A9TS90_PHYPA|nr:hypothetical protein PHYPA_023738 [Physcomitrium patens]
MSFSFFKQLKPKTPAELVRQVKESLSSLDTKTMGDTRLLEKSMEEVDKNLKAMKDLLLGDSDTEPNAEVVAEVIQEICKIDVLELIVQKIPTMDWEARKDCVHIWGAVLRQKVGATQCGLEYLESHTELLDYLVLCYENKEVALNCGTMLRECARYVTLAKYMLESVSFEMFFKFVETPNFDVASDAFATFKELLTRHNPVVVAYLSSRYASFFANFDKLLRSTNYVTRRQSLKLLSDILLERSNSAIMMLYISDVRNLRVMMTLITDPSKNIQASAFHVFKVFVANPQKPPQIVSILAKNREKLLRFLDNFHIDKEDEQFDEEKELLVKEIEGLSSLNLRSR